MLLLHVLVLFPLFASLHPMVIGRHSSLTLFPVQYSLHNLQGPCGVTEEHVFCSHHKAAHVPLTVTPHRICLHVIVRNMELFDIPSRKRSRDSVCNPEYVCQCDTSLLVSYPQFFFFIRFRVILFTPPPPPLR